MTEEEKAKLADYPFMLRVVLAAWDVIDRHEDQDDELPYELANLKQALVTLADRGMQ